MATETAAPKTETRTEAQAVRPAELPPLAETVSAGDSANIGLLLDVSVPVVAQLGSTEMRIRDILRLTPGSIIELDKLAGEPVDLFVRGKLFAQGEVVVVDENFGIRITKVLAPEENARASQPGTVQKK